MRLAAEESKAMLGPEAHAVDKDELGSCVDVIGWSIDLDTKSFTLSERNRLKTLYGLLSVELDGLFDVRSVERLASWFSRYALVFPLLRPVSRAVYDEINGRIRGHQKFYLSEASKQVVLLWRAALISMSVRGRQTARLMSSVKPNRVVSNFKIVFDGCPMGAGAVVVILKCQELF
jgi:hypothetical protein